MGAGHGHRLHYHGHSRIHRAPAHLKVLSLLGFMIAVVMIPSGPSQWWWGYGAAALVLGVVVLMTRVPLGYLAKRMLIEFPFAVFALLMPVVGTGPRVEVLGLSLSEAGLHAGATLLIKSTLGVLASLTLAATTEPADLLRGLQRLRVPAIIVAIMGFMIRYLEVVTGELQRMVTSMRSRGLEPRQPKHWPILARGVGALFVRSYERGERVHLAMLSRGFDGTLR